MISGAPISGLTISGTPTTASGSSFQPAWAGNKNVSADGVAT